MRLRVEEEAFNLNQVSAIHLGRGTAAIDTHASIILEPLSPILVVNTDEAYLKPRECPGENIQEILELGENDTLRSRIVLSYPENVPGECIDLCSEGAFHVDILDLI